MAKILPLPPVDELPDVVLFHREDMSGKRIIMQVPVDEGEDSESYIIDTKNMIHAAWLRNLPGSKKLTYALTLDHHLAYAPRESFCWPLKDLDAPGRMKQVIARAHAERVSPRMDSQFGMRHRRQMPEVSKLRRALGGRGGRL